MCTKMKANVLVGLGNPLAGDDGVGWHVAQHLRNDPRTPEDTEILSGGTDLLRQTDHLIGRKRVILVDAILNRSEPGKVTVLEDGWAELEGHREHAHHCSVIQTLNLLRMVLPSLAATHITLIGVSINTVRMEPRLSPCLAERLPDILERVLQVLNMGMRSSKPMIDAERDQVHPPTLAA
jgi:hydrogenase maturation protease